MIRTIDEGCRRERQAARDGIDTARRMRPAMPPIEQVAARNDRRDDGIAGAEALLCLAPRLARTQTAPERIRFGVLAMLPELEQHPRNRVVGGAGRLEF